MPRMRVEVLRDAEIDVAFLLVSATTRVDLERWRRFVCARRADGGGVLALTVEKNGPLGVLSWFSRSDLLHGSTLVADNLIVFELQHSFPGEWMLLEVAEEIAQRLHCGTMEVRSRARTEAGAWRARGWSLERPHFSKAIVPLAPAGGGR